MRTRRLDVWIGAALGAIALIGVVAAVAVLVTRPSSQDWAADPGTIEALPEAALWIRSSDGLNDQRLMTIEELHEKYPLPIELPQLMPGGYHLFTADLFEAGRFGPSAPSFVFARYSNGSDNLDIRFIQSVADNIELLGEGEETHVNETRALFGTRTDPVRYDWLQWSRCGRLFELQSAPGQFSKADLVRIAESVGPAEC